MDSVVAKYRPLQPHSIVAVLIRPFKPISGLKMRLSVALCALFLATLLQNALAATTYVVSNLEIVPDDVFTWTLTPYTLKFTVEASVDGAEPVPVDSSTEIPVTSTITTDIPPLTRKGVGALECFLISPAGDELSTTCTASGGADMDSPLGKIAITNFNAPISWTNVSIVMKGLRNSKTVGSVSDSLSFVLAVPGSYAYGEDISFPMIEKGNLADVTFDPSEVIHSFPADFLISWKPRFSLEAGEILQFSFPEGTTKNDTAVLGLYQVESRCKFYEWRDTTSAPLCSDFPEPSADDDIFECVFTLSPTGRDVLVSCTYNPTESKTFAVTADEPVFVILTGLTLPEYALISSVDREVRVHHGGALRDSGSGRFISEILNPCSPGFYSVRFDGNCLACPIGTFSDSPNTVECSDCPLGQINNEEGQSECKKCAVGTFSVSTTACEECAVGEFQGNTGSSECNKCAVGQVTNTTGSIECTPCPQDSFAPEMGLTECTVCSEGTATSSNGASKCTFCALGYHKSGGVDSECVKCEPGLYMNKRSQDATCTECNTGEYSSEAGSSACSKCEPGTVARERGMKVCEVCASGRFSALKGSTECKACSSGRHANLPTGATSCIDCTSGQFAIEGSTSCSRCSRGRYSVMIAGATSGPGSCTPCEIGSFAAQEGASACLPCEPGSFAGEVGSEKCESCAVGRFAEASRMGSCAPCPIDFYTNKTGTTKCDACEEGLRAPDEGSDKCMVIPDGCARGEYGSLVNGEYDCHPCQEGKYNDEFAQEECKNCPSGRFNNAQGRTQCQLCAAGSHQTKTGQTACAACPLGRYTDMTGFSVCSPCPVGHTTHETGRTQCDQCGAGTIAPFEGLDSCENCVHSKYNARSGASACSNCPAQTATDKNGATGVTECKVVQCPSLEAASSGISRVVTDGIFGPNRIGSVAVYSCLPGFALIGESTRVCVSEGRPAGKWTGSAPTCSSTSLSSAPPSRLKWLVEPTPTEVLSNGNQFLRAPTVAIVDESGRIITDGRADRVPVTISAIIPQASAQPGTLMGVNRVYGTVMRKPSSGLIVLDDLTLRNMGLIRFVASAPGYASAESNIFTIKNGPSTRIAFTSVPLRATNGSPIRSTVVVTVTDEWGFPVSLTAANRPPRVSISLSDNTMMLNGVADNTLSADCVDGVATFESIVISLPDLSTTGSHTFNIIAEGSDLVSVASPDITLFGSESNNVVERERETARAAVLDFSIAGLEHITTAYDDFTSYYKELLHLDLCAALGLNSAGCKRIQVVGFGPGDSAFKTSEGEFTTLASDVVQVSRAEARYLVDPYLRELSSSTGSDVVFPAASRPTGYEAAEDVSALDAAATAAALAEITAADAVAAEAVAAGAAWGSFSAFAVAESSTASAAARAAYSAASARADSPMRVLEAVKTYSARVQINPPTRPPAGATSVDTVSSRSVNTLPPKELALMLAKQFENRRSPLRLGAVTSHVDPASLRVDTSGRNVSPFSDSTTAPESDSTPWYKTNGFIIGIAVGCGLLLLIIIFVCVYKCLSRPKQRQEVEFTATRQSQNLRHPAEVTVDIYSTTPQRSGNTQKKKAGVGRNQQRARRTQPMNF